MGKGLALAYKPPHQRDGKTVVKLTTEDIKATDSCWFTTLIGYVPGDAPYEKSMDKYVTAMWNFVKKPQNIYHTDGYYIFQFASIEEGTEVVQAGPYTYHNKPFILKPLVVDFVFDTESITTVPL
ncbi:hypothetical protein KY290_017421 [Solanum tuberosum]|uniref:DUF4283 domain-containing protein n=1 Tax=Solanum tuberosum TaxID=4113 RepID=A0ABQ7VDC7_SOLTU|nr:hypothetical protein KY290_017421 [Solanum tuberosum]